MNWKGKDVLTHKFDRELNVDQQLNIYLIDFPLKNIWRLNQMAYLCIRLSPLGGKRQTHFRNGVAYFYMGVMETEEKQDYVQD